MHVRLLCSSLPSRVCGQKWFSIASEVERPRARRRPLRPTAVISARRLGRASAFLSPNRSAVALPMASAADGWPCHECTVGNDPSSTECECCEAPRRPAAEDDDWDRFYRLTFSGAADDARGSSGGNDSGGGDSGGGDSGSGCSDGGVNLFAALKAYRLAQSRIKKQPAFCIFDNKVLDAIVAASPRTLEQLGSITGIGPAKVTAYGQSVIDIVARHLAPVRAPVRAAVRAAPAPPGHSLRCFACQCIFAPNAVVCAECGLLAPSEPLVDREYVVPSGDFAEGSVRRLKKTHLHHVSVKRQFFDSWGGGAEVGKIKKGAVQVKRILEIRVPLATWKRFVVTRAGGDAKYKAHYAFGGDGEDGEDGCTGSKGCKGCNESKEESNDLLLFHGTSLECRFGIDDEAQICESKTCNVCSILTAGLTLDRAGTGKLGGAVMPLRYGKGLYFSGSSGKSNDCKVTVFVC